MILETNPKKLEVLMRKSINDNFKFFNDDHKINVYPLGSNNICLNYRTTAKLGSQLSGTTHFDIQLIGYICYLLNIELEESLRGKGAGWTLYESIHQFSRNAGYKNVRQTASGWTPQGKTRKQYLLERGYIIFEENEVELTL